MLKAVRTPPTSIFHSYSSTYSRYIIFKVCRQRQAIFVLRGLLTTPEPPEQNTHGHERVVTLHGEGEGHPYLYDTSPQFHTNTVVTRCTVVATDYLTISELSAAACRSLARATIILIL